MKKSKKTIKDSGEAINFFIIIIIIHKPVLFFLQV